MILFSKQQFEDKRLAVVVTENDFEVHFKLVELLRILFDMCDHTYINEMYIKVFEEFPNTKYVTLNGLTTLADISTRKLIARRLQTWAHDLNRRIFINRCFKQGLL
ncbi:Maph112 [Matsumuraeses phaseoli granulovirus]|uniref:Maph112 n=1 Tax=Matsumuraeses phaseoli granulovirus TaxID=2760664 RepID=A0AAE7SYA2_9BBAC|nr:Maph112 [Matsumuraeses phaseoli granulovirus]QOD40075.1 Maph112 [Matsumuraeses phaseoli granulovirus]